MNPDKHRYQAPRPMDHIRFVYQRHPRLFWTALLTYITALISEEDAQILDHQLGSCWRKDAMDTISFVRRGKILCPWEYGI